MKDISKLPKWVQQRINDLNRELDGAKQALKSLKSGTKPSPFYLEGWDTDDRFYLEPHLRLIYEVGSTKITLTNDNGKLRISSTGTFADLLKIEPVSGNVIRAYGVRD